MYDIAYLPLSYPFKVFHHNLSLKMRRKNGKKCGKINNRTLKVGLGKQNEERAAFF